RDLRPLLSGAPVRGHHHRQLYRPRRPQGGADRADDDRHAPDGSDARHATIGLAAPIIIIIARLLPGLSVGGEFGSALAFLASMPASVAASARAGSGPPPAWSRSSSRCSVWC